MLILMCGGRVAKDKDKRKKDKKRGNQASLKSPATARRVARRGLDRRSG